MLLQEVRQNHEPRIGNSDCMPFPELLNRFDAALPEPHSPTAPQTGSAPHPLTCSNSACPETETADCSPSKQLPLFAFVLKPPTSLNEGLERKVTTRDFFPKVRPAESAPCEPCLPPLASCHGAGRFGASAAKCFRVLYMAIQNQWDPQNGGHSFPLK